jgi:predicted O-methyltransferase YrrM
VNFLVEIIKYQWNAKRRHGIHSPFVYSLSDKCFNIKLTKEIQTKSKELFKPFLSSKESIEVTDLGKGSRRLKKTRTVRDIFKTSSSRGRKGEVLFKLSNYFGPNTILELGTSLGVGTWFLHHGHPKARIVTVEGCPKTFEMARKLNPVLHSGQIHAINSSFEDFLKKQLPDTSFDMVYIDGHHDGKALLKYLSDLENYTHKDTLFIIDDIRWSSDMLDAWNKISKLPSYHVTVDLFYLGLVWKRSIQEKEHFILRPS